MTAGLVGATAIYSVARAVAAVPLPTDDAARVVQLTRWTPESSGIPIPVPTFFDWLERNRSFAALGAFSANIGFTVEGTPPTRVRAAAVSSQFFEALGARPELGSAFGNEADQPGGALRVILSGRLWVERFGSDPQVLGSSLPLDGKTWEIVGVMPAGFDYPVRGTDLWIPLGTRHRELEWENRSMSPLVAVGRLKDGIDLEQARRDLERVTATIADDTGVNEQPLPEMITLEDALLGNVRRSLWLLGSVSVLVLLIAVANVAGLLLSRGFRRRGEIAVRLALGAARWSVARLLLVESTLLSLSAVLLALAVTPFAAKLLVAWMPSTGISPNEPSLTLDLLGFGFALALLSGVACGLVPAWRSSRKDPAAALHDSAGRQLGRHRVQAALVVAEVAAACALMVVTGLMIRSLGSILSVDPGLRSEDVLVQRFDPDRSRYQSVQQWIDLNASVIEKAKADPNVEKASVSLSVPFTGSTFLGRVATPDLPLRPDLLPLCHSMTVSEDFLEVVGLQLVAGRGFTEQDDLSRPLVAVVDEGLAGHFWPGQNPLGRRIALEVRLPEGGYRPGAELEPIWREVIGVVSQIQMNGLRQAPKLQAYAPLRQLPTHFQGSPPSPYLLAKTRVAPSLASAGLRMAMQQVDPSMPVDAGRSLEGILEDGVAEERLLAWLLSLFTVLALVLSTAGVYSVQALSTAQRTRELGLRMALGARPRDLLLRVTGGGLRLALFGLVLGVGASYFASRLVESRLFGVGRFDVGVWWVASATLLLATGAAALLPAWRASRTDPVKALSHE